MIMKKKLNIKYHFVECYIINDITIFGRCTYHIKRSDELFFLVQQWQRDYNNMWQAQYYNVNISWL